MKTARGYTSFDVARGFLAYQALKLIPVDLGGFWGGLAYKLRSYAIDYIDAADPRTGQGGVDG